MNSKILILTLITGIILISGLWLLNHNQENEIEQKFVKFITINMRDNYSERKFLIDESENLTIKINPQIRSGSMEAFLSPKIDKKIKDQGILIMIEFPTYYTRSTSLEYVQAQPVEVDIGKLNPGRYRVKIQVNSTAGDVENEFEILVGNKYLFSELEKFDKIIEDPTVHKNEVVNVIAILDNFQQNCFFGASGAGGCSYVLNLKGLEKTTALHTPAYYSCRSFGPCTYSHEPLNKSDIGRYTKVKILSIIMVELTSLIILFSI